MLTTYEKNLFTKHHIDYFSFAWEHYPTIPVEYLIGLAPFYGRDFIVNSDVLIPRIETEEIIDLALSLLPRTTNYEQVSIVDIGTGSGCIGITLYLELQKLGIDSKILLSDISEKALAVAKRNIDKFKITNYELRISDTLSAIRLPLCVDLIIANLPYIPSSRILRLDKSVKDFEPHLALDGGPNGLTYIKKLIHQAGDKLKVDGVLILEIDADHKLKDFAQFKKDWKMEIKKDKFRRNRFLTLEANVGP